MRGSVVDASALANISHLDHTVNNYFDLDRLVIICYTLMHGTPSELRSNGNVGDDTIGLLG